MQANECFLKRVEFIKQSELEVFMQHAIMIVKNTVVSVGCCQQTVKYQRIDSI